MRDIIDTNVQDLQSKEEEAEQKPWFPRAPQNSGRKEGDFTPASQRASKINRLMIPKRARLPRASFRERGYRTIATPFFSLKVKDNGAGTNRIGVVVGKSVDKRATRRNFWERQAKAQLLTAPNLGKDFILTAYPKINTLTRKKFLEEIKKILKDLHR